MEKISQDELLIFIKQKRKIFAIYIYLKNATMTHTFNEPTPIRINIHSFSFTFFLSFKSKVLVLPCKNLFNCPKKKIWFEFGFLFSAYKLI